MELSCSGDHRPKEQAPSTAVQYDLWQARKQSGSCSPSSASTQQLAREDGASRRFLSADIRQVSVTARCMQLQVARELTVATGNEAWCTNIGPLQTLLSALVDPCVQTWLCSRSGAGASWAAS